MLSKTFQSRDAKDKNMKNVPARDPQTVWGGWEDSV